MMRATVQPDGPGELESMSLSEQEPVPAPGDGQLLVKVYRSALNRMDLLQRKGLYPVPADASPILGVEVSGTIEAVGPASSGRFKVGDRVMSLLQGGGYAEFAVANECTTMHASHSLSFDLAVSVPEHLMTASQLLFQVGGAAKGESVLLHAAASGVGLAAIQMARGAGLRVFATVRSEEKAAACRAVGAELALNLKGDAPVDWVAAVKAANGGRGVNMVLDPVGQDYAEQNVEVLEMDGRWVLYGLMSGAEAGVGRFLGKVLAKRLTLAGSTLRSRSKPYKAALAEKVEALVPSIAAGDFTVRVAESFPFTTEGVRAAHAMMGSNQNIGKILLRVREDDGAKL